jgi:hypothetical protein
MMSSFYLFEILDKAAYMLWYVPLTSNFFTAVTANAGKGMDPVNLLLDKLKYSRCDRFLTLEGIEPENLFDHKAKLRRFDNLVMDEGINPLN